MKIMRSLLAFILAFVFYATFAQTGNAKFKLIDKKIKSIQSDNIDTLAKKLTANYKTETEKVRSIFRWITENIEYDINIYHDTTGIYKKLWQESIRSGNPDIEKEYNNRIIKRVLEERKAICDGYPRFP